MNPHPTKIMIFGRPGSGKSTFALKLHKHTGIPLYHLDKYFYESNWKERNTEEFLKTQQEIVDKDTWIIDGNSVRSLEIRYSKADLVLYFKCPRWRCLWRIFKRLFDKDPEIKDRADGCREVVRFGLLKYMWTFEERVAYPLETFHKKYPKTDFIIIRSKKDLKEISQKLGKKT